MEKKRCSVDRSRRMLNDACVTVEREKERRTTKITIEQGEKMFERGRELTLV